MGQILRINLFVHRRIVEKKVVTINKERVKNVKKIVKNNMKCTRV